MTQLTYTVPTVGQLDTTEEPLISTALTSIKTTVNGNLDTDNLKAAAGVKLTQLEALTSSRIIVGSAANIATARAMSGDVTIDNTGVTAIGSSKVTNAMLHTSAGSASKTARETIQSDSSSALTDLAAGSYTSSGTFITAPATGLYLVYCQGQVTNNLGTSGFIAHYSSLLDHTLSQTGKELHDISYVGPVAGISVVFTHIELLVINSGENVHHAIKPTGSGSDIAAGGFTMKAIQLSN